MKIYLVIEDVDLGYHVLAAYESKSKAEDHKTRLNESYKYKHIFVPYDVEEIEVVMDN